MFLGGPDGPTPGFLPDALWGIVWFLAKLFVFLYVYVWLRGTLPRMRYDQLMDMGWKVLIPLSLGWLLVVAAAQINPMYVLFTFAGFFIAGSALYVAMGVGQDRAEVTEGDDFGTPTPALKRPKEQMSNGFL